MDPAQWISNFRAMHQQAKSGTLGEGQLKKYVAMAEEFARSLMSAQNQTGPQGVPARRAFRVAHVFPIELANHLRTTTRDLACTGFTALAAGTFKEGDLLPFALTLSRESESIKGEARVTSAPKRGGSTYLSCSFERLEEAELERIERALFDAALTRFGA